MFPWTDTKRTAKANEASRRAMYKQELEERAAMLLRLGYPVAAVRARLHANVAWDFALEARPRHAAEVDAIVDAVARRLIRPTHA